MREIVVGVDGSQESRHALDRALHLGQVSGRPVVVAHVWAPSAAAPGPDGVRAEEARTRASALVDAELCQALSRLPARVPVRFRDHVAPGRSGEVLTSLAEDAGLVVLGAHEHGKLVTLLGSTVTHTLHNCECPVMVVPRQGDTARPFRRVVVGVDGSSGSRSALRWGLDIAARDNASVEVLHVVPADGETPPDPRAALGATVPEVRAGEVRVRVVQGDPGVILSLAVGMQDLLVVGSRGTGRFAALVLGSVAAQVVTSPRSAVAVVRAGSERLDDVVQEVEAERVAES